MQIKKIRTKLLLPVFIVLILVSILGVWALNGGVSALVVDQLTTTQDIMNRTLEENTAAKVQDINGNIQRMANKALEQAVVLSNMPGVLEAYQLAHQGDLDAENDLFSQQARENLRQIFNPVVERYKTVTGVKELKLHFHLPSGRSLVRLWRDGWQTKRDGKKIDISDDLRGFRRTVVEINQGSHGPLKGVEVGRGGFAIRGLTAIADAQGNHLGSAEILLPFNALIEISKTSAAQNYAVYMNADLLTIATKFQDAAKYPVLNGRYVLCATTDAAVTQPVVDSGFLAQGARALVSKQVDDVYVSAFPIDDYSGKQAGVLVVVQDITQTLASLHHIQVTGEQSIDEMKRHALIGALFLFVLIGGIVFVVTSSFTTTLQKAVAVTAAIAGGDLDQRLQIYRDDEMGDLAKSLNTMSDSLADKVKVAKMIADGDLTAKVHLASNHDEFGAALQNMVSELSGLVTEVSGASSQIVSGAAQVSDVSQSLSQGATEQAAAMEEIASSMAQIESQTKQSAENTNVALTLSRDAIQSAEEGNANMSDMVGAMDEINVAGQGISKIIKVIDEIAFQTNLLALNAAVEAARAGQHGKGFAVVAEEVRNLAARSAKAAQETAVLIEGSVVKAKNGTKIAETTASSLQEIMTSVTKMSDLVAEISTSANEQSEGISQVNIGLNQIDTVTQQNTASAEEGAAAAEELSSQAEQLRNMLAQFKVESSGITPANQRVSPSAPAQIGW
ncbi:MAG: hypothetical protein B6I37_07490 [Desulfobacteraceae bacterium 4572_35.2]|nr:MAG: hypothetical protein B6I37_07490 [Desulfobacteraceae bacterium 4572_35.2]